MPVIKDLFFSIDGVDLSDHVISLDFPLSREMLDDPSMGIGNDTKKYVAGLKDAPLSLELKQDYNTGSVDDKLFGLWDSGSSVPIIIRFDKTAGVGITNPNYSFTGAVESFTPIGGAKGELLKTPCSIKLTSGNVTRAIA